MAKRSLTQRFQEPLAVWAIPEDRLPVTAPGHHTIDRPRRLDSDWSRHHGSFQAENSLPVNGVRQRL
jgi:hypothetical protein